MRVACACTTDQTRNQHATSTGKAKRKWVAQSSREDTNLFVIQGATANLLKGIGSGVSTEEHQVEIRTLDFQEMLMQALAMVTLQRCRDRENTSGRPEAISTVEHVGVNVALGNTILEHAFCRSLEDTSSYAH